MHKPRKQPVAKPVLTSGVKAKRYFPGKAPQQDAGNDLSASDTDSEQELEAPPAVAEPQRISIPQLAREQHSEPDDEPDSESRELLRERLRARQRAAEESSSSDSEGDKDQGEYRRQALLRRQQQMALSSEEEGSSLESGSAASGTSDESDSDEDGSPAQQIMLKPVFVPKARRTAQPAGHSATAGAASPALGGTDESRLERRVESVRLAAEEAQRARSEVVDGSLDAGAVDDSDDVDVDAEIEAWRQREVLRIDRDRDERESISREEAERDQVRGMTEEQRHAEGVERARTLRAAKAQRIADLRAEKATEAPLPPPTSELAYAMRKGRSGSSKWRGYRNEDTSRNHYA
ncbi:hypothetical protein GGF46_002770 [Coemansia sp. RSA 552]|nr:hypothetical protein GGF46_002770 [Coemansia sp. RSA 552]